MPVTCCTRSAWFLAAGLLALVTVAPFTYYRASYSHQKRLRPIAEGRVYRSGAMTAAGFREAIARHGIKTVVNFQEEALDPDLPLDFFGLRTVRESKLVAEAGAEYVPLVVDLVPSNRVGKDVPEAVAKLRALFDDEAKYPILIHCRAGLHRTGVVAAMYRIEYQGWSTGDAYRELKSHGFGETTCHSANDQVQQYVLRYQSRAAAAQGRSVPARLTSSEK